VRTIDLDHSSVRELNARLHARAQSAGDRKWLVKNPRGKHAIAVGLDAPVQVTVEGPTGYYCAGHNKHATVTIAGYAGPAVAENIMSGTVRVKGNASQYAAASGRGGLVVIEGDASTRCGISMKGVDIVVGGAIGNMSAFMAQRGRLVVCGEAGQNLGDSIYEAVIYVRGKVASLGADCVEQKMSTEDFESLRTLLKHAGIDASAHDFKRYGSARKLYHFHVDHADAY
jgi:glutamate synthase domain-containing protein 3